MPGASSVLLVYAVFACFAYSKPTHPTAINDNQLLNSNIDREILKVLDKLNIGVVENGVVGTRVDDHVPIVVMNLNFKDWAKQHILPTVNKSGNPFAQKAVYDLCDQHDQITESRLKQTAAIFGIPTIPLIHNNSTPLLSSESRHKRQVDIMAWIAIGKAAAALGLSAAAIARAEIAIHRTATNAANIKRLSDGLELVTGSIEDLNSKINVLDRKVAALRNITTYLEAKAMFAPFFEDHQRTVTFGLHNAVVSNNIAPGFINNVELASKLKGAYGAGRLVYETDPSFLTRASKIMVRAIQPQSLKIITIVAVPIVRAVDTHILVEPTAFGNFNSDLTRFTVPLLPPKVALTPGAKTLKGLKYPTSECTDRNGFLLCHPHYLKTSPPGAFCSLELNNNEECHFKATTIDKNGIFVKATMFGDAYIVSTTCPHYMLFDLDDAGLAVRVNGTFAVPKPTARYTIPMNRLVDFCPGHADPSGTKTIRGFGLSAMKVEGLKIDSIESSGMLDVQTWDQQNAMMAELDAKIEAKSGEAMRIVKKVQDSNDEELAVGISLPLLFGAVGAIGLAYYCHKKHNRLRNRHPMPHSHTVVYAGSNEHTNNASAPPLAAAEHNQDNSYEKLQNFLARIMNKKGGTGNEHDAPPPYAM